jgi:hypothetical protein
MFSITLRNPSYKTKFKLRPGGGRDRFAGMTPQQKIHADFIADAKREFEAGEWIDKMHPGYTQKYTLEQWNSPAFDFAALKNWCIKCKTCRTSLIESWRQECLACGNARREGIYQGSKL